jgi:hypothetical protein
VNQVNNFNNMPHAVKTLFQIMTTEGWTTITNIASDSTKINYIQLADNEVLISKLIFMMWIIVGNFLILNLFVGVIIDNFNMIKEQNSGVSLFRKEQKLWVEIQRLFLKKTPQKLIIPPEDPFRN